MEVKVVLDVAIIGLPNAGKSKLLSALTAARPKVADYPFTTTEPVLGIAEVGYDRLVLGELPALVPGACAGKGLGASFLRHAERAKAVLFLLDGASENISGDLMALSGELACYGANLEGKARAIAINKVDLPEVAKRMPALKRALRSSGTPVFFVSAMSGGGLSEMMPKLVDIVRSSSPAAGTEPPVAVFRPPGVKKGETRPAKMK
jgi:GTP-binding protein